MEYLKEPPIADTKFVPRARSFNRIVPELSFGSTTNTFPHSNSIGLRRVNQRSKSFEPYKATSDISLFEEFRHTEIVKSHKIPDLRHPYWFFDVSEDQSQSNADPPRSKIELSQQASWVSTMLSLIHI